MVDNIYDIFISYRRDCSEANAKILQLELEKRGYRVFLDYVGLNTNEPFPDRIRKAIEQAPIFILMLAPNTLDRCADEKDFLRLEIEHAISINRVIISVNQDRLFKDFPPTCPPILKDKLGLHNFAEIFTGQQYDSTVNHLVKHRIAPVVGIRKKREEEVEGAEINLQSDLDCRVYRYGEEWCDVKQEEFKSKKLKKGQHKLKFVSTENNEIFYEILYEVKSNSDIKYLNIKLLPIQKRRERLSKLPYLWLKVKKFILRFIFIPIACFFIIIGFFFFATLNEKKERKHLIAVDNFTKALENSSESTICMFDTAYYWLNQVKEIDFDNDVYIGYRKDLNDKLQRVDSVMRNRYDKLPASASQTRLNMKNKLDSIQEIINKL